MLCNQCNRRFLKRIIVYQER